MAQLEGNAGGFVRYPSGYHDEQQTGNGANIFAG
jgi:hypothetical protein